MAINASDLFMAPSGLSGHSGASGTSGASGKSGTSGYSGVATSGYSGYSGVSGQASQYNDNILINGGGDIWQRQLGTESTLTNASDDAYFADRWNNLVQTAVIQCARVAGVTNMTQYAIRQKQTQASAQRIGMCQIMESVNSVPYRGQALNLSFQVNISNSQAVRYAILEWQGTADGVTSDVVNDWTSGTYTAGNFFVANMVPVVVGATTPSAGTWTNVNATGTVSTSCNNLVVFIWTEGTAAQNVTMDMSALDLYVGSITRAWNPRAIAKEWNLCQRYAHAIPPVFAGYGQVATTTVVGWIVYPPNRMRVVPALVAGGAYMWSANDTGGAASGAVTINGSVTPVACAIDITRASGTWTAARAAAIFSNNAAALMVLTAEM